MLWKNWWINTLYTSHLQNVIADTIKQTDRSLLQGKFERLVGANVLLWGAFFLDTLTEAKQFSLLMQKKDISISDVIESIETTKQNYKWLLNILGHTSEFLFGIY